MAAGSKEQGAGGAGTATPVQISLGYSGGVWIEKYFDQVLSSLGQAVPGVQVKKVVYPTYDDLLNGLPTQVAAKTNPDVLYWTNEQLADYANNGCWPRWTSSFLRPTSICRPSTKAWSRGGR